MKYQSKRHPDIYAALDVVNEEYNTCRMIYLTGENAGKAFDVTLSTLKRWWKKVEGVTEEQVEAEIIETPYPEPEHQEYIPKPQSVIEYEESKRVHNNIETMPQSYDEFADLLAEHNVQIKKVNSGYISMNDKTKLKLLKTGVGVLASTELAEELSMNGFKSKPCIEKGTPFRFDFKEQADFEKLIDILGNVYKND
jgi:hypothetical protein